MYQGKLAVIPLGSRGFQLDLPHTIPDPSKLFRARNVTLSDGAVEKDFGSRKWNQTALESGVRAFIEYYPTKQNRRVLAVCNNGRIYRFIHPYMPAVEFNRDSLAPETLVTSGTITTLACGAEETGNPKKIFIFSGQDLPQVITGDSLNRKNITNPPADWTGRNQPIKGILYKNRVVAWGNDNSKHRLYFSSASDHENFTSSPLTVEVYPGEGDGIVDCFEFKGRFFILKGPSGLYYLNDSDADVANWTIDKLHGSFGGAGPHCVIEAFDDILIANSTGSITSLVAADTFGDIASADMFKILRIERLLKQELSPENGDERHFLYCPSRRTAYVTYRSYTSARNNRILQLSFNGDVPEPTLINKDQPNCLGLIKDNFGLARPCYGSDDGFIYVMDDINRNVNGNGYLAEILTLNMDFGAGDPLAAELEKAFDFVEIVYEPTGNLQLNIDWYIDGLFYGTVTTRLDTMIEVEEGKSNLNSGKAGQMITSPKAPYAKRLPIGGNGRRIAFRCYNDEANVNFKLLKLNVYYKPIGTDQTVG